MNQEIIAEGIEDLIRTDVVDGLAIVTLNRPDALNALSLEMIRQIASALHRWRDMDSVKAVLFVGAGERAFCAGGDVKAFYSAGMDYRRGRVGIKVPAVFFAEEYSLNKQIFHYSKPTIAFMNGITMGGGYGIAGNCRHRIATEKTVFAMPEAGIGFYPDVGSMYHLLRAKAHFGRYLALTGLNIDGSDMVHVGLADFYIKSNKFKELKDILKKSDDLNAVISGLSDPLEPHGVFQESGAEISRMFSTGDLENILQELGRKGSVFSARTLDVMRKRSPTSIRVTASYLQKAASMSFDDVMETDFTLTQNFIKSADLYEGIRAQLIDKDKSPVWNPSSFGDVDDAHVEGFFAPTGYHLRDVQIFES